jgi:DnaJ like chaperone protein
MQKYIKWFFMVAGGFRFGAPGAIIGFFVGYIVEEILAGGLEIEAPNKRRYTNGNFTYSQYQTNLLILISALIKADGYITKEKILFVKAYLFRQFGPVYGSQMMITLKDFVEKNFKINEVASNIHFASAVQGRVNLFSFLNDITIQNGTAHPNAKNILQTIAENLGISYEDFENIVNRKHKHKQSTSFFGFDNNLENAYATLKISKTASDTEVKKAYRKLVLQYHPDKTELDEKTAAQKFDTITKAYEVIKKVRNIK